MVAVSVVTVTESDAQLKEVVVTATKTEKNTQDITQSVTAITAKEIRPAVFKKNEVMKSPGCEILDSASISAVHRAAPMPYVNGWVEMPMRYVLK